MRLQSWDGAIADLEEVIKKRPSARTYFQKGSMELSVGKCSEARATASTVRNLYPTYEPEQVAELGEKAARCEIETKQATEAERKNE